MFRDFLSDRKRRVVVLAVVCIAFFGATSGFAQISGITPLNPLNLSPQTIQPEYVWSTGVYGTSTTSVDGNSTTYGTTLLLNTIDTSTPATANYSLSFLDLKDLNRYAVNFTLYVPGYLSFASNSTPLVVSIAGRQFLYSPQKPINYSWYAHNPAYVPTNSSLVHLPQSVGAGEQSYLFFAVNFSSKTLAQNDTVGVTISVPAYGQIYIPEIILSADASFLTYVPATSTGMGLVTLPFTAVLVAGVYFFLRKFQAWRYAGTLAAAFCLRVGLAPLLMHSDVSTFIRYSQLYFNYHLVNLQTWIYGLVWYFSIVIPVAPAYAAGISPSFSEWDLLLKLPGIVADLLTFLVIVKILRHRLSERDSYILASVGWLFNPLVIYFSSAHGLGESVVALFLALTALGLLERRVWVAAAGAILSALTLIPMVFVFPSMLFSRRVSWTQRAALIGVPVSGYLIAFGVLYHSLAGLSTYAQHVGASGVASGPPLGYSLVSPMSYLFLPYVWFGLFVPVALGGALVVGAILLLATRGIELFPRYTLPVLYGSLLSFFFTYEVFYVQHLIWVIPLAIGLVAYTRGASLPRMTGLVVFVSLLAFFINYLPSYNGPLAAVLAYPLFAVLLVPLLCQVVPGWPSGRLVTQVSSATRALAVGLAIFLSYSFSLSGASGVAPAAVAGTTAIAFLLASYPMSGSRRQSERAAIAGEVGLTLGFALSVYLLSIVPQSATAVVRLGILGLLAFALFEVVILLSDWLTKDPRVTSDPDNQARGEDRLDSRGEVST